MLKLLLCSAMLLLYMQPTQPAFYVKVEVDTELNATYIIERSNLIIPQDRMVKAREIEEDVSCLVNDLMSSGIFENVEAKLIPTGEANIRKLVITPAYHRQIADFVVAEIILDDFPEVDATNFQSALSEKGIRQEIPFLKYYFSELMEKIDEALHDVYPSSSASRVVETPWITIRLVGEGRIKLVVSQERPKLPLKNCR